MTQPRKYFEIPVKRLDIHVHLGIEGNKRGCFTAEERMQFDKMMGIDRAVILPYPTGNDEPNEGMLDTEQSIKIVQQYPEHYSFFCNVNPKEEKSEEKIKAYKDLGALGVGEFGIKIPFDDERMDNIFQTCAKLELPFLFHISPGGKSLYGIIDYPGLPLLEKVLSKYPDTIFIGHSQPFWYEMGVYDTNLPVEALNGFPFTKIKEEGRVIELMRKYPNLYADLSANSGSNAILRDTDYGIHFLKEFQDRLFFGTDLLNTEMIYPIGQMLDYYLLSGKIDESCYSKICRRNAEQILKL